MKLYKLLLTAAVAGAMAVSCNDDGYWDAATFKKDSQAYSFKSTSLSHIYGPEDVTDSLAVIVTRQNTSKKETLHLSAASSNEELFYIPDSVVFEAGQNEATCYVKFLRDMEIGEEVEGSLTIDSVNVTVPRVFMPTYKPVEPEMPILPEDHTEAEYQDYVADSTEYEAKYAIWVVEDSLYQDSVALHDDYVARLKNYNLAIDMSFSKDYSWHSIGKAWYTEDLMTTFFGVDNLTYQVEMLESDQVPGIYRLVNAYGAVYEYNEDGDYDASKDYYLEIHAEDPTAVYLTKRNQGLDWGYGYMYVWSYADYFMVNRGYSLEDVKGAGYCGTLENGIITFPAKTLLIGMENYNNLGFYTANNNGAFKVVMPGTVIADYSVGVAFAGRNYDADNNETVLADVELGANVASAYVAIVPRAAAQADLNAVAAKTVEGVEVTASGRVELPLNSESTGTHTIYIVSYDEEGNPKLSAYAEFMHIVGVHIVNWQPVYLGSFTYTVLFTDEDAEGNPVPFTQGDMVMYQDPENPNHYCLGDEEVPMFQDATFEFYMDGSKIIFEDQFTGLTISQYGDFYVTDWSAIRQQYVDYYGADAYDWGSAEQSYFDASSYTLNFNTCYYGSSSGIAWADSSTGMETFQIEEEIEDEEEIAARHQRLLDNSKMNSRPVSKAIKTDVRKRGSQSKPYGSAFNTRGRNGGLIINSQYYVR